MKQGIFISFEGGEGAGKSTQIRLLAADLQNQGLTVCCTKEPGGSWYGQRIRQLILMPSEQEPLVSRAELLLYVADRAQHVETVIRPALAHGQVVICDRFADSTLAYQGYGRQLDIDLIQQLNHIATQGLQPDLTFWLDIPPAEGLSRITQRAPSDRLESEALAFHQRLHQGYQKMATADPQRWRRIDATQSESSVQAQITTEWKHLIC